MPHVTTDFLNSLDGFNIVTLETDPHSIYGLSADLTLSYLNPGWFSFSQENDGEPHISNRFCLGTHIGSAMTGPVKEFYLDNFTRVLESRDVWHHDYECSSPYFFRVFHQSVFPLYNGKGLVIINSLTKEHPHEGNTNPPPNNEAYTNNNGLICQCSNCRRVKKPFQPEKWDWVPQWVKSVPDNTSHTICPVCFDYYYEFRFHRCDNN